MTCLLALGETNAFLSTSTTCGSKNALRDA